MMSQERPGISLTIARFSRHQCVVMRPMVFLAYKECAYFLVALRENIMGTNLRFLSSLNLCQPSSPVSISEKYGQPQKGNSWKKSMERPSERSAWKMSLKL